MQLDQMSPGVFITVIAGLVAVIGILGGVIKFRPPNGYAKRLNGHLDSLAESLRQIDSSLRTNVAAMSALKQMIENNKEVVTLQQGAVTNSVRELTIEVRNLKRAS